MPIRPTLTLPAPSKRKSAAKIQRDKERRRRRRAWLRQAARFEKERAHAQHNGSAEALSPL